MAKAITVIPATKDKFTELPTASIKKRKVAAYARVSTDSDEQFTSYEAQIDYYTQYIKKRDDWEFVKVYTDEGIKENATTQQSQKEYNKKYNHLVKRYEKALDRLNKATADRDNRMQRDGELRIFIGSIEKQPLVLENWDERLWISLLESATVHADNRITFRFKDGTEIDVASE